LNLVLLGLGVWFVFDGVVSISVFAGTVDKASMGSRLYWLDQTVRVVRIIAGFAVIAFGIML
jgi:hypothetical protein